MENIRRRFSNLWETPHKQPPREAYQFYQELIQPDNIGGVIGPFNNFIDKPALMQACHCVSGGNGSVFVIDPQWGPQKEPIDESSEKQKKHFGEVAGLGDFSSNHLRQIQIAKSNGIKLTLPQWLGPDSAAQKIELPNDSLDVIVDHSVSVFLSGGRLNRDPIECMSTMNSCYREYNRVLKPGGILILQTDRSEYRLKNNPFIRSLLDVFLENNGFDIEEFRVTDAFRIPVSTDVYDNWEQREFPKPFDSDKFSAYSMFKRMVNIDGAYYLVLDKPWSQGPDMLICTKANES